MIAAEVGPPVVIFGSLREANVARQAEWDTGGNLDLAYAGNEFAGEVSEALAEALIEGGPDLRDLANELADVVICIDLIAIRAGLDQIVTAGASVGLDKPVVWTNEMACDLQYVCNTIKKLERERHGMPGSRATLDDLALGLENMQFDAEALATCYGIDLNRTVARKFNETSMKVGLKTRLVY